MDMNRFWAKVERTESCWLWTAALNMPEEMNGGYGYWNNRVAHRLAYEQLVGPIPEGMVLDHLCRVRRCVNPEHLEVVDRRTNNRRGVGFAGQNAAKTHCPQGHPYSEENLVNLASGFRRCKQCKRDEHAARSS